MRIYFEFTNNSQEKISLMLAVSIKVYQEGKELKSATLAKESETDKNMIVHIDPLSTLECSRAYLLNSKTAPVDVKVFQFFGDEAESMIVKTFTLQ